MILCARIATILPPILSVSAILTRIDPYYTVINVLLPPKFIASLSIKLFLTLLRLILMFCIILELCRAAYILFVVVIFFALVLSNVLRLLEQYYAGLPAFKILEAKQYILFYQEICVLIFATNLALSLICFASLTIGFGMFIVSGVILIKLWRRAPILNLVICLILILGGVYFLLVQFPRAAEVHSATERMKKRWCRCLSMRIWRIPKLQRRYMTRKTRSLRRCSLFAGFGQYSCFNLSRKTQVTYIQRLLIHTVDVILLFGW